MKLGFTGTQFGMTEQQLSNFGDLITNRDICPWIDGQRNEFHHGDCVGADADAFVIAQYYDWITVAHPCDIEDRRAHTKSDIIMPVRRPLERNYIIVQTVDVLAAAPLNTEEVLRSGTWSTIRRARACKKPYYLM